MNENIWGRGNRRTYSAKRGTNKEKWLRRSTSGTKTRNYECLSGTYVDPPGADPLGGAPDIRHRKPREIVPQVSADASIKTRWCYYSGVSLSIIFVLFLPSLSSRYSSSSPRVPGERVLVSTVYFVLRQQRRRGVHSAHRAPFPFSLDSHCAHIRAPEIPNHPFTLPFYLFPPVVGPTLSRFKSITHSWEMITTALQVWEAAARVYNLQLNIKR